MTPNAIPDQTTTTRSPWEVQDSDAGHFAAKLRTVFAECHRLLKDDGLLVFTYHHSRGEGWKAVADAILGAGFTVVNSQPVKAEMSVATPKSLAKDPIQLDIIIVCRKQTLAHNSRPSTSQATERARAKIARLLTAGFHLSHNDRRIVLFGQLLTTLRSPDDVEHITRHANVQLDDIRAERLQPRLEHKQCYLNKEFREYPVLIRNY